MTYTAEMTLIHQMTDAMIDLLTYAQWKRIRFAAERGGFDAGLKAMTRVSRQLAAEKIAAANAAAFQQGRLMGLQMRLDVHAPDAIAAAPIRPRRVPVESSVIASVGSQRASASAFVLEIEFKDGSVYQYDAVPQGLVDDLLDGRSVGSFFTRKIKPFYTGTKIDA